MNFQNLIYVIVVLSLQVRELDWGGACKRRIAFFPLTKNGTSREVPLSSKAAKILEQQRIKKHHVPLPITYNTFRLSWDKLKKRAAISTPLHTFAPHQQ